MEITRLFEDASSAGCLKRRLRAAEFLQVIQIDDVTEVSDVRRRM